VKEREVMQENVTQVKMEEARCNSGTPITVLRFAGDITSASKAAVLGTYQGIPESTKRILLDFSHVEYLNSSGIALIIQMMIAASKSGQTIQTFGLKPHFQKVFTMVGITKYTTLHPDEQTACAAFSV
jgi:anti-sigma B factor antagonist